VTLLVFEEGLVFVDAERAVADAEVGANHGGENFFSSWFKIRCWVCGRWRPCRV
jgi:hypothetical protein